MKPKAFDYHRATSVDETIELLGQYGDDGKLLAGGQSLIPMMNFRIVQPAVLIDINKLSMLAGVTQNSDGSMVVGALTRERTLEQSNYIHTAYPLLSEALPYIGHLAIRSRGTIGGSLVQADPSGELPLVSVMLDSVLHVQGPDGIRRVPADEFFITYLTVDVAETELLVAVEFPKPESASWAFEEYAQRRGDFAIVAAAAGIRLASDGTIEFARFGLGGANPTPLRVTAVEEALIGQLPTAAVVADAIELAMSEIDPDPDVHASTEYRKQLVRVLGRRALARALDTSAEVVGK